MVALVVFAGLLVLVPLTRAAGVDPALGMLGALYRAGALVFGGGHVVLPLLDAGVVQPGWVPDDRFLAGYGAAQAVPGPLFSFGAYLGAIGSPLGGVPGGAAALLAIYLPSFLLLVGILPFWGVLRTSLPVRRALSGVNAAVVGLLAAALYQPVWTGAVANHGRRRDRRRRSRSPCDLPGAAHRGRRPVRGRGAAGRRLVALSSQAGRSPPRCPRAWRRRPPRPPTGAPPRRPRSRP